jgi:hypothetical protein
VEVTMSKPSAVLVLVIAVLALAAGLVFLCAAVRQPSRLMLAAILLLGGAALAAWSGKALQRLRELEPERLADRITDLAAESGAEISISAVISGLAVPNDAALDALNWLEHHGRAHRERRDDKDLYIFPGLKVSKVARRCPYCGSEFSVKTAVYKCPHCGGDLRLQPEQ